MVKIIIINGLARNGKSKYVSFCSKACESIENMNAIEFSTIDYVKEVATSLGWKGSKNQKDREFLHDLKMALEKWNDSPSLDVFNSIDNFEKSNPDDLNICFVNIREADSITSFKALCEEKGYDVFTMLVTRPGYPTEEDERLVGDILDGVPYDYIMKNDGDINDWERKAEYFIKYFHEKFLKK